MAPSENLALLSKASGAHSRFSKSREICESLILFKIDQLGCSLSTYQLIRTNIRV